MMLARVADSLYWLGRYVERAEHLSRLSAVMLNATLDRADTAAQAAQMARAALGDPEPLGAVQPIDFARALVMDRDSAGSVDRLAVAGAGKRPPGPRPDHQRDLGAAQHPLPARHRPPRRARL